MLLLVRHLLFMASSGYLGLSFELVTHNLVKRPVSNAEPLCRSKPCLKLDIAVKASSVFQTLTQSS